MTKVAFAGAFSGQLAEPVRARLSVPCEIVVDSEADVIAQLHDCDVLVGMAFSKEMAAVAPNLRLMQVAGAGVDRIDQQALGPTTRLANVFGHEAGIAEYVMGAMISLTRRFSHLDAALREGRWESQFAVGRTAPPLLPELSGKTLAILGFGHIGQAVARRAAAFDMRVIAMRRNVPDTKPVEVSIVGSSERIDEFLGQADFVAVTLPLSDETRGLIDRRRLQLMKPSAYLINVGRGEIIDEAGLYEVLAAKRIAGAALDVWYRYPRSAAPTLPSTLPFHELDNVIMTPHVSGWTEGMLEARAKLIAENIERTVRGEPLLNEIKPT